MSVQLFIHYSVCIHETIPDYIQSNVTSKHTNFIEKISVMGNIDLKLPVNIVFLVHF